MKPYNNLSRIILVLFCLLFYRDGNALAFSNSTQLEVPNKILKISSDPWCPFNCREGEKNEGLFVEIAREAFKTQGFKLEYKTLPWTRSLRSVRNGEIDIIIGSGPSDPGILTNFELGIVDETVFMVPFDSPITMDDPEEILNYRLGLVGEYEYDLTPEWGRLIDKHPVSASVNTVQGEATLVNLLDLDRVDIIVGNYNVFKSFLKNMEPGKKYKILRKGFKVPVGLGFDETKKGEILFKTFSEGLKIIRASGKLSKIFKKYNFEYKGP